MVGIGILTFVVYIGFVILWNTLAKRSIAEAMAIGLLIACAFNGSNFLPVLQDSVVSALSDNVMLAIMLFTFMSAIVTATGIIGRLVNILNSLLGRIRGGPAYVSACASALFGLIAGSGTGNAAAVGSITIPWMKQTGWPGSVAATMNAGNAGLGIALPPSTPMLLMIGFPVVAQSISGVGDIYFALICGGLWTLVYRFILVRFYVSRCHVPALPNDQIHPLGETLRTGGSSLTMFLGCIIPIALTAGPLADWLGAVESFGSDAVSSMTVIVWVPILITVICLIEGHKYLPKTAEGWKEILLKTRKTCSTVGGMSFFALAGSEALTAAGFGADVQVLLENLGLPQIAMVLVVGLLIGLTAGPLNASATIVALGSIAYMALVNVGIHPVNAVVAILIFASTEGASPPSSAPIFISCSIAEEDDVRVTFKPLVFHYVIPIVCIGALVALGILPIAGGG